jgi:hypothetical protein
MTLVFIENLFGSGQIITVSESFDGYVLEHRLKPGENRRLALSRFKSVVVNEERYDAVDSPICVQAPPSRTREIQVSANA